MDFLVHELSAAYGLGKRSRTAADVTERARKAVTNRIRASLTKLRAAHPTLWQHFYNSLKTGTFCAYTPENSSPWEM